MIRLKDIKDMAALAAVGPLSAVCFTCLIIGAVFIRITQALEEVIIHIDPLDTGGYRD